MRQQFSVLCAVLTVWGPLGLHAQGTAPQTYTLTQDPGSCYPPPTW